MAVVTVTGIITIELPLENTEEINIFMSKYKHLTPYPFFQCDYLEAKNSVTIDYFYNADEDTTLLSIISTI